MNKTIRKILILLVTLLAICSACGKQEKVTEVTLGEGLPRLEFAVPMTDTELPADASAEMKHFYTSETDEPDVYVYQYDKNDMTLEDFGNAQAAEHKVFCNMIEQDGISVANIVYYEVVDEIHYITRAFIYEAEDSFVKVCWAHKTEEADLGNTGNKLYMMKQYDAVPANVTGDRYEMRYMPQTDVLPRVTVSEFPKGSDTLQGFIDGYAAEYELKKGELIKRNGFDAAFIGYVDQGVFYVKAYLDCGETYVLLEAENEAPKFQHVVNALIDTIH